MSNRQKVFCKSDGWMRVLNACRLWHIVSLFCVFILVPSSLYAAAVTEQGILDAVLGKRTFTDDEIKAMDLNGDGKVDVADAVFSKKPIANFYAASSEINETAGTHVVVITFSQAINGTLKYTVGGTASAGQDYDALSGSVAVSGSVVFIQITVKNDTVYEGNETIVLSLLPGKGYLLGATRSHTVTLKDNPNESGADYLFTLSNLTPGFEGSTKDGKGFPGTQFSRMVSVNITFSANSIVKAFINVKKSIGIVDTITKSETIPAKSVSYSTGKLEMVFEYQTQYDSFVTDASITSFDYVHPSLGNQTKKTLTNTLTVTINTSVDKSSTKLPFDVARDKFTPKYLEGTCSLHIDGALNQGTGQFFVSMLGGDDAAVIN